MAWDRSKPASSTNLNSAEMRANYIALARTLGGMNLVDDSQFDVWAAGDAAVPTCYKTQQGSPTIARETSTIKSGSNALKVTADGGGETIIQQRLLASAEYDDIFDGMPFTLGCWVYASNTSAARISFYDGTDETNSWYHTGDSTWQFLKLGTSTTPLHHTVNAAATELAVRMKVAASQVVYFSGLTCFFGETVPEYAFPSPWLRGFWSLAQGTAGTGDGFAHFMPSIPGIVEHVQLYAATAPSGADLIYDFEQYDGSTWQTMFSTLPQIDDGDPAGEQAPDGTYRYRCFSYQFGDALSAGSLLRANCDQTGDAGDVRIAVRMRQPQNIALNLFRAYNHFALNVA